ncbi:ATP-binding cassette sub-family G member 4-like [Homalodisca vitripennis]|nr:ATP-binding cassette sub-family G member 4-like [Homalodisca vitripennis]
MKRAYRYMRLSTSSRSDMEATQPTHVVLEFRDLCYSPPGQEEKVILKNVNGRFRPFKVSAILGPSGAGKTSLLNILTCNRWAGVQGNVTVNGQPWNRSQFRRLCCYITQEFAMMELLTVRETLQIAANLKLPGKIWCAKRKVQIEDKVDEILELLILKKEQKTQVRYLSGGEKKRLSIGVELITNPPVMFFDEPTSGLDSSASLMVMEHLQSLAQTGITVVVVIHQPSSRCFQYCDDVLLLSCGRSLFNGPANTLADTFATLGYHCPPFFNIAEFAVEVANMKPDQVKHLVDNAQEFYRGRSGDFFSELARRSLKGVGDDPTSEMSPMLIGEDKHHKITIQRQSSSNIQGYPISTFAQFCTFFIYIIVECFVQVPYNVTPTFKPSVLSRSHVDRRRQASQNHHPKTKFLQHSRLPDLHIRSVLYILYLYYSRVFCAGPMLIGEDKHHKITIQRQSSSNIQGYPISTFAQFCILFKRCTLCINRDLQLSRVRLTTHAVVSLLLGILFYNFGTDASKVYGNFSFIFFNVLFVFFATSMPTICTFPKEADVFLREQSNNWYPIRAYYFAKILADLPLQILCPTIFVAVGWYMTGQPLVLYRFGMLWLVSVLVAVLAQTIGNACGAALTVETALFIVPSSTIPVLLLSGFFVTMKDLYAPFQVLAEFSYFKFAFEAACQSVFGYDRPKLACSQPYCHYKQLSKFLHDIGMSDFTFWHNIVCLATWIFVMQLFLYILLRWRVSQAKV